MANVDFPASPTINQLYTAPNGQVYQFIAPGVWAAQSGVAAFPLMGVTDGSNAPSGQVGEVISSVVASPGVTLTTGTAANVTSIPWPAGDWDVQGEVWLGGTATAATVVDGAINTNSATLPTGPSMPQARFQVVGSFNISNLVPLAPCRISVSAATTAYLVASVSFSGGTCAAYGKIWARRAR